MFQKYQMSNNKRPQNNSKGSSDQYRRYSTTKNINQPESARRSIDNSSQSKAFLDTTSNQRQNSYYNSNSNIQPPHPTKTKFTDAYSRRCNFIHKNGEFCRESTSGVYCPTHEKILLFLANELEDQENIEAVVNIDDNQPRVQKPKVEQSDPLIFDTHEEDVYIDDNYVPEPNISKSTPKPPKEPLLVLSSLDTIPRQSTNSNEENTKIGTIPIAAEEVRAKAPNKISSAQLLIDFLQKDKEINDEKSETYKTLFSVTQESQKMIKTIKDSLSCLESSYSQASESYTKLKALIVLRNANIFEMINKLRTMDDFKADLAENVIADPHTDPILSLPPLPTLSLTKNVAPLETVPTSEVSKSSNPKNIASSNLPSTASAINSIPKAAPITNMSVNATSKLTHSPLTQPDPLTSSSASDLSPRDSVMSISVEGNSIYIAKGTNIIAYDHICNSLAKEIKTAHTNRINFVIVTKFKGQLLLITGSNDCNIIVMDLSTSFIHYQETYKYRVMSACLGFNNVYIGLGNGSISVISLLDFKLKMRFNASSAQKAISCLSTVQANNNSALVVAGSMDGKIYLINVNSGKVTKTITNVDESSILALLVVDQNIYFGSSTGIFSYDTALSSKTSRSLYTHPLGVTGIAAISSILITSCLDGCIRSISHNGDVLQTFSLYNDMIYCVNTIGRRILCGYRGGGLEVVSIFDNTWKQCKWRGINISFLKASHMISYLKHTNELKSPFLCKWLNCKHKSQNANELVKHIENHF